MTEDNVIELPVRNRFLKLKNKLRLRLDLEQRKIVTSASIISILFMVAVINDHMVSQSETVSGREVASLGSGPMRSTFDTQWESSMAQKLAKEDPQARNATFGARPSALDQMAYGALEGKYALRIYRGHVQAAEFADRTQNPIAIEDRARFLVESAPVWATRFKTVSKASSQADGSGSVESFALLDESAKAVGQVQFHLDGSGRLISMKLIE